MSIVTLVALRPTINKIIEEREAKKLGRPQATALAVE